MDQTKPTILIIDDIRPQAELLAALLASLDHVRTVIFDNGPEALEWCRDNSPDVVITDQIMPGMNGLEVIRSLREIKGDELVPIVVLTAHPDNRLLVEALSAGATDFLCKPVDQSELLARIQVMLNLRRQHLRLLQAQDKLREMATTDPLTGIFNRRAFIDQLFHEIKRSGRNHRPFSLITLDIDHFKAINDQHGHAVGDDALIGLTRTVARKLRQIDAFARMGGEEFCILLPETGAQKAVEVAQRIRRACGTFQIVSGKTPFSITVSAGVATWDGHGPHELMKDADDALYQAKAEGRNRVCLKQTGAIRNEDSPSLPPSAKGLMPAPLFRIPCAAARD